MALYGSYLGDCDADPTVLVCLLSAHSGPFAGRVFSLGYYGRREQGMVAATPSIGATGMVLRAVPILVALALPAPGNAELATKAALRNSPATNETEASSSIVPGPDLPQMAAAIMGQIKPCYVFPYSRKVDLTKVRTTLDLHFKPDGSLVGKPTLVDQAGISEENRPFVHRLADAARRAVLRCAPLRLPPELYKGGWEHIQATFAGAPQR